jgi:UDP-N-acetylglucosamine--N-acetylmuramyl-(pentapeptide) pyrophosphoryl-undecaprenol N-acetylglucosamine transferase
MIWVVSGATGGHLYPALALISKLHASATFIVPRDQPVGQILAPYSYPYTVVAFVFRRCLGWPIQWIWLVWRLWRERPRVMLLMGGGICVPLSLAAWVCRIPMVAFEQNTIPGRATRVTQCLVGTIITSFESTKKRLICQKKVQCLGNPIRTTSPILPAIPIEINAMNGPILLVIGGSQGSRAINEFIEKSHLALLASGTHIIHLTGAAFFASKKEKKRSVTHCDRQYMAFPYIADMAALFSKATHVVCRSGATTLAEIKAYGVPCILVPFPFSKDNHQVQNAKEFSEKYANVQVIFESDLTIDACLTALGSVALNTTRSPESPEPMMNSICAIVKTYLK